MHVNKKSIDIIIATYNGEDYIAEQIYSIINMSGFDEFVNNIIICDDNSQDQTLNIVKSLVPAGKLIIIDNKYTNLGPIRNFERGILQSSADFIMLSDQDDVWIETKLNIYIKYIKSIKGNLPFVIFSDLEVVDINLKKISSSFLEYQSIPKSWYCDINNLLIQNTAPGCTMLFNRELIEQAMPLPADCIMHDWWLMLVAKTLGEVHFINKPLIKYRQHGNNQVGAKKHSLVCSIKSLKKSSSLARKNLISTINQMNDLNELFGEKLSGNTKERIKYWNLCFSSNANTINKLYIMLIKGLKKSSPIKTLGMYYLIIMGNK